MARQAADLLQSRHRDAEKVILVCDNLNTHIFDAFYEAFAPQEARALVRRLEIHYAPKHSSWPNMAESEPGADPKRK